MTPEEYIVERILHLEQENNQLRDDNEITNLANKAMQDKYKELKQDYNDLTASTEKYCKLLDELKSLLHIEESATTKIKVIKYTYDEEADMSHCVAFEDERVYKILIELLGPLKEEL